MKKMKSKAKAVNGDGDYVEKDEKYNKKLIKKSAKGMKKAGVGVALAKSQKEMGYSKMPKVKPSKKGC